MWSHSWVNAHRNGHVRPPKNLSRNVPSSSTHTRQPGETAHVVVNGRLDEPNEARGSLEYCSALGRGEGLTMPQCGWGLPT